jgi:hypothetical protein
MAILLQAKINKVTKIIVVALVLRERGAFLLRYLFEHFQKTFCVFVRVLPCC